MIDRGSIIIGIGAVTRSTYVVLCKVEVYDAYNTSQFRRYRRNLEWEADGFEKVHALNLENRRYVIESPSL